MPAIAYKAQDNSRWAAYIVFKNEQFVFLHRRDDDAKVAHNDKKINYWGADGRKWTATIDPASTILTHWMTDSGNGGHTSDHIIYVDWNDDVQKAMLGTGPPQRSAIIEELVLAVAIEVVGHLANPPDAGHRSDQPDRPNPNPPSGDDDDDGEDDDGEDGGGDNGGDDDGRQR